MKIAIAADGNQVSAHFGHCEKFAFYSTENGCIKAQDSMPNPGHRPGYLPEFLHGLGVEAIIAGGMGGGAIELFQQMGIQTVTGASGEVSQVAERYLSGELQSTKGACTEHQHADECGGH